MEAVVDSVDVSGIEGVVIGVVIDVVDVVVVVVVAAAFEVAVFNAGDFVVNLPTKVFTASFTFGKKVKNENGADEEMFPFSDLSFGIKTGGETGKAVVVGSFVDNVAEINLLFSNVETNVVCSSVSSWNLLFVCSMEIVALPLTPVLANI